MTLKEYSKEIIKFIKDYVSKYKFKGAILGLSGGIDSALVLGLLIKALPKENIKVLIMPIESNPLDEKLAIKQCKAFGIKYDVVDLTSAYKETYKIINLKNKLDELSASNIKVRLRMVTLYAVGQANKYVVVGTDNLDERYTGYFTKYGDGAADILPIAKLTKSEVRKMSKMVGVIPEIISRPPTAGLFKDQKDENDLGVSYDTLDAFLMKKPVNKKDKKRIQYLHKISAHKVKAIPTPKDYIR